MCYVIYIYYEDINYNSRPHINVLMSLCIWDFKASFVGEICSGFLVVYNPMERIPFIVQSSSVFP